MGGAVAVGIAGDRPERVERLVLIDAAGFNLEPGERPWLLRLLASPIGAVVVGLPKKRSIVALALRQVFHDDGKVTPHRVDEYLAPLERPGAFDSARSLLSSQGAAGPPFREQAGRVRAPTLVVWGRDDEWIPLAQANLFLRSIPDSRLRVIDACGHVPQEEQPEETAAALLAFLGAGPGQAEAP
jgi:pimeloyl-ACP methyl ester carboxylesterase